MWKTTEQTNNRDNKNKELKDEEEETLGNWNGGGHKNTLIWVVFADEAFRHNSGL